MMDSIAEGGSQQSSSVHSSVQGHTAGLIAQRKVSMKIQLDEEEEEDSEREEFFDPFEWGKEEAAGERND